jgi:hypothetical protein
MPISQIVPVVSCTNLQHVEAPVFYYFFTITTADGRSEGQLLQAV